MKLQEECGLGEYRNMLTSKGLSQVHYKVYNNEPGILMKHTCFNIVTHEYAENEIEDRVSF